MSTPINTSVHAETLEHSLHAEWPHILSTQGTSISGMHIFGFDITTTVFSTWIFMGILFIFVFILYLAIKTEKLPRIRTFGLDIVHRLDDFVNTTIGSKENGRIFFSIIAGLFVYIFLGNISGLVFDWLNLVVPSFHDYLRSFNSDFNTTIVMGVLMILLVQITSMVKKWFFTHWKHYVFNFSGENTTEKIINVPIGWIHFVSDFAKAFSLAVRLFANIFAGVTLIAVMAYIGGKIPLLWGLFVLPFWFYELFVAAIQAYVFCMLSLVYLNDALTVEEH